MKCQGILEGGASCPNDAQLRVHFAGKEGGSALVCKRCAMHLKLQAESFGTTLSAEPLERRPYVAPTIRRIEPPETLFADVEVKKP